MSSKFITQMPLDILLNILTRLDLCDLRNLMITCKLFKNVIMTNNTLWRIKCSGKLILQNKKSESKSFSWYNKCRISHNWCKGIYRSKVIIQHTTNYMPWLQLCSSQEWYLSVGSELRCYSLDKRGFHGGVSTLLWSIHVPTVKRDDIRTNDISRFIVKNNIIICGNRDGCAVVYTLNNARQRPSLLLYIEDSHENGMVEVSAVENIKDTIITASSHCPYICFWEYRRDENNTPDGYSKSEYKLLNEIGCRCIATNDAQDKLALGPNGNSKPLLLDVNTGIFLMSSDATKNVKQVVRDIQWHDANCIAYVTHLGKLHMIDIRSSAVVYETQDPFQSSLYCLKTDSHNAVVVGSSEYSRCVLFDLRSPRHVQMYFTQKMSSPIYSLDFDSTKLVAAADRGIASLNFNVSSSLTQAKDFSHVFEFVNR